MNDRQKYFNAAFAVAVAMVLSSAVLGYFFAKAKKTEEAITVTGSARKRIKADLVTWSATVTYQSAKASDAYKSLSESVPKVKQYLISKGIAENEITISAVTTSAIQKRGENGVVTSEISGYALKQSLQVRSSDVDKVAEVSREATELINQDILIESNAPEFLYTKLADLKIQMLGDAAADAKTRAARIAESTGSSVGSVRSAKMGVIQVTAADSTDVSDEGISDSSSIDKDITAVVNVSFAVS
ncbi:MAG TPA: SIMPL domain-containing protein [Pyrinomonadaceae bacterium]